VADAGADALLEDDVSDLFVLELEPSDFALAPLESPLFFGVEE